MLDEVVTPDRRDQRSYVAATAEQARASVAVVRRGQPVAVTVPMDLEVGDEITVHPPSIATVVFPEGHEVTLMPNTRVRLGSIYQYFGELFIRARGLFKSETEYWTAGVKGTEFSIRLNPDKTASVAVLEGRIALESNNGRWAPVEVNENEVATLDRDRPPSKELKQRAELDAIRQLMRPPRPPRPPLRR